MSEIKSYSDFKKQLNELVDINYRDFSMRITPSQKPLLGVRIPKIRELVKAIPKEKYPVFLQEEPDTFEEILARGMIITRLPYDQILKYFNSQVSYIDNWCTCDIFCSELKKSIKSHQDEFYKLKIKPLLNSSHEFKIRVGLILLLGSYKDSKYLPLIFGHVEQLADHDAYYVKMALAWLVAECFIKYPDETNTYLQKSHLSKWTFNKTISKICDSYRITPETKAYLKTLRK